MYIVLFDVLGKLYSICLYPNRFATYIGTLWRYSIEVPVTRIYEVRRTPENILSLEAFAAKIPNKNAELLDGKRMPIAICELCQILEHLGLLIEDGAS